MRRNLFTAAKGCLAVGCLSAAALLFVPIPQASSRYLVALEQRLEDNGTATFIVDADEPSLPDGPAAASGLLSGENEKSVALTEAPVHRIASNDVAASPLAGLEQFASGRTPVPAATSISEFPAIADPADAGLRTAEAVPPVGLVPQPTPDPVAGGSDVGSPDLSLEDEVRSLRAEVIRLAQTRIAQPQEAAVAGEMRELLAELRDAERFRRLEEELRRLQGRSPGDAKIDTLPATAPTPPEPLPAMPPGPFVRTIPSEIDADRFSLQVEAADVTQVIDLLGQMAGWNVVIGPGVSGSITLNLRDVTLEEALASVLRPRDLVAERRDNLLFVLPRTEAEARKAANRELVTKVYRPQYINVTDLEALITPLLTPNISKISVTTPSTVGLELDATAGGGDSLSQRDALVVQDYRDVIDQIDEIIREMDIPPLQVVIEAYVLRVRLDNDMKFGVNFALLSNTGRQLVTSGSGAVLGTSTGFPSQRDSLIPPLPQFLASAAGLRYGFLTGDVTGFIEALERISDTSLVASPSLRVLNKQKAELIIGQKLGYKTQTFNNQQTIENVEFLDVGTKLILRPFASPDGLVRMEIHPERSSGFIDANGLPQVDTTEVTTNVMVRDGATVVVGGLIDEQTEEDINQVPVLGSIPILGYAFRNSEETIVRSELIVLITPRIVCDPIENARGEEIRAESERRAAYFGDHLAPLNRRNLARFHTDRAADLYDEGRLLEAHDHARHALAIRKNDGDALRLKTRIEQAMQSRRKRFFSWPTFGSSPGEVAPVVPIYEPGPALALPPPGHVTLPGDPLLAPPAPTPEPPTPEP